MPHTGPAAAPCIGARWPSGLGKYFELGKHFVPPVVGMASRWDGFVPWADGPRGAESPLGVSPRGHCGGPAAAPEFLLLCKLLLFALTNLFFLFFFFYFPSSPSPLHPFLIAASNSHTHSSLLTRPFGIRTWHLQSSSFWKGKEKKTSLKKKKKATRPLCLAGDVAPSCLAGHGATG